MKIVINTRYGGFHIPYDFCKTHGVQMFDRKFPRTDPELVEYVETHSVDGYLREDCSELRVANIPDEATDWRLMRHDGNEMILYVMDGKIHEWPSDMLEDD